MTLDLEKAAGGLIRRVQKALGMDSHGATFAALLYGHKGIDGLENMPSDWLAENAREGLEFIASKPKGRHKIRIRRIAARKELPATSVVEILNDDMPFLVDSILAELQARGLAVTLLLHPILKTRRDKSGRLLALAALSERDFADGHQESYIAAHLRLLSDQDGENLVAVLSAILDEVRVVVEDWKPMLARVAAATQQLEKAPAGGSRDLLSESVAFLNWLQQGNFTFLGAREFELRGDPGAGDPETADLQPVPGSGLGVLRNASVEVLRRGTELVAMTPEVRRFFFAPAPLIITKANVVSRVHRRAHMDYVGIKTYRSDGAPKGEVRIVGLLTSQAYIRSPSQIPILRHKVAGVLAGSGYPPDSHDGKALLNILDTFPRDELFQIGVERLQEWTEGILDLETRPRVRVFARVDRFDRFVSLLIYVPRDRYTSQVRERIGALLSQVYVGRVTAFYPFFPAEGPLVRVQFIIGRNASTTPDVDVAGLERSIAEIVRTWGDRLADAIAASSPEAAAALRIKYGSAFSAGYAETFSPARALEDIKRIERLGSDQPLAIDFYREPDGPAHRIHAAIYRFGAPMRLSERVPLLENLGFLAIDERSYHIRPTFPDGARDVTLHDMVLETADGSAIDLKSHDKRLEECFLAVFRGDADNDGFNRLVISAGAEWREAAALRAYAAYLRQLGAPFGLRYLADTLHRHAGVSRKLLDLFHLRFKPHLDAGRREDTAKRTEAAAAVRRRIEDALAGVQSLDEDRILRWFLNLIDATVRTTFYQAPAVGGSPAILAFKLDSKSVDAAPQPRPYREIWVYSPRVEGIHLRFAPIARGGIRWSDRAQDFRTEILGLVRAQVVKNAVIVPSGSKGGFLPKLLPRSGSREEIQKEGIAAYSIFISALLNLTDNIKNGSIAPPAGVVRHDGDDPYLVVAADKGTATFSDIANGISQRHGFWLGDAFASGGSAGYDHKKMAITARGAWECVKRHFREMDVDIQAQPFRVVGVGDMSGDVFGNGMLLSPHIQLLAAFDHRDIFVDPNPSANAFAERRRLFDLPRSSWQDYDKSKISKGGGVFSRASKSVPLSEEMRLLLGIDAASLPPNTLINAILKCETDLLWFGGIGTYVRAGTEIDAEVGDRANDAVRVSAAEVRAKVIGEGANLGVTQRGRIEFAMRGGRINTDSIDNSAGVNTSDQEVNIKIAVAPAVESGKLNLDARNALLIQMTDEVAAASLENNYQQSLALSLAEARSARDLADYGSLMRSLQARGLFDRPLESLPSDIDLQERARTGRGMTRPELAVLLSYAKIALQHDLLESKVPDAPELETWLIEYFPPELSRRFAPDIRKHSLRREIVALGLTNALLNRGGPAIAVRLAEETSRTTADVAVGFLAARAVFDLPALWQRIDALDGKLGGRMQLALYAGTQELVNRQTLWFLRNGAVLSDLGATIARHRSGVAGLASRLDTMLSAQRRAQLDTATRELAQRGVPAALAADVARLDLLGLAPSITEIAGETGASLPDAGAAFLSIGEQMSIAALTAKAAAIATPDHYDRLAVTQAICQLSDAQSALARGAIAAGSANDVASWLAAQGDRLQRVRTTLEEIASQATTTVSRLLVAAGQLGALTDGAAVPAPSARTARPAGRAESLASENPPARRRALPSRS